MREMVLELFLVQHLAQSNALFLLWYVFSVRENYGVVSVFALVA